ncbi:MAG: DUF1674 domain-containing protein [Proteobacteria bacterium]|nr:DUF1674 domain-containing protein [Pseudomonadota bacterium]
MTSKKTEEKTTADDSIKSSEENAKNPAIKQEQAEGEIGGPSGLEPTRYGDWERKGIVSDF